MYKHICSNRQYFENIKTEEDIDNEEFNKMCIPYNEVEVINNSKDILLLVLKEEVIDLPVYLTLRTKFRHNLANYILQFNGKSDFD